MHKCVRSCASLTRLYPFTHVQDARFMATNDLCAELQKDIKMDVNMVRGASSLP